MMTIITCITAFHDISLVALSALLCGFGSWVTSRLYRHARQRPQRQAVSWYLLTALTAGIAIWCTHFVAMLGFRPNVPVSFDLALTLVSFAIAVLGSALGVIISTINRFRFAPVLGGAILGLSIAAMHYAGMIAYRVQGVIFWDRAYLALSIILAVAFGAAALALGRQSKSAGEYQMAIALTLGIVTLHFTGMAAFRVSPLDITGDFINPEAFKVLALAITGTATVIVMGALFSYVIENRTWQENIQELTKARNAAESASRAKSEFLGILSHELRTPLTIVLGYASILGRLKDINAAKAGHGATETDSRIGDQAELYGHKITVAANHLLGMINEILDYTSMELGEAALDRTAFPVRGLLEEVETQFAPIAAEKGVTISVDCDEVMAFADRARCLQILSNLVSNAFKFARSSDITLRARLTATGFNIEVQDNGCGIPEESHNVIFNAFQQLEPTQNRSEGGAGLGLAICKTLAIAHGGEVTVQSAAGAGTTFTVAMPTSAIQSAQEAAAAHRPAGLRLVS
ncbi:MHYT domain-containing protein [Loktanella salsilacus]|uniref:sensor histidine kinase n=1 Tax=Loktanella salsilacus TaxID=195913 RepID=UPI0037366A67